MTALVKTAESYRESLWIFWAHLDWLVYPVIHHPSPQLACRYPDGQTWQMTTVVGKLVEHIGLCGNWSATLL